jgi:hypothetical protein
MEDEEQSRRFLDLANELEAAGDLNLTEAEARAERVLKRAAPEKRRPPPEKG